MSVAHIGKLQENTAALCKKWLRNSSGACYQRIRICISGEVETPSSPIRLLNSGCDTSGWKVAAAGWNSYPGGMSYDSRPGGMSRIPYSLYSGFAYGFQRTLLNLRLLW